MKKSGFNFRYNEYEKPSSKSYLAPNIKEIEILKIDEEKTENGKVIFRVYIKEKDDFSEIAKEQLTLHFMNTYKIKNYSDIILEIIKNE